MVANKNLLYLERVVDGVSIGEDFISIHDKKGEIVRWTEDEWLEEPEIITAIAKAIQLNYTKGAEYLRELLKKEES